MQNLPKQKIVKPTSIRGYDNGQIPAELLVECGFGSNYRMIEPAARAMKALIKFYATHPDNIEISTTGCYRSYNAQVKLFLERFTLEKTDGILKAFNGRKYYLKQGFAQAATPGKSNHGWGLASDLAVKQKGKHLPVTQTLVNLLIANAHDFGFCAELDAEPWHWVYFAGNKVPPAVLAVENGTKRFLTYEELQTKNAEKQAAAKPKKMFADKRYSITSEDWAIVERLASAQNVDPLILVAIGFAETAWGTKGDGLKGNILGAGSYDSGSTYKYAGVEKQCEFALKNFKKNKVKTIQDIKAGNLQSTGKHVDGKYVGPAGSIKWASADTADKGFPWTKNVVTIWTRLSGEAI